MKKFSFILIVQVLFSFAVFPADSYKEINNYTVDVLYAKLRANDQAVYEAISQKKVNLNKENMLGYTVLSYAAIDNELEIAKFLLKNGANRSGIRDET